MVVMRLADLPTVQCSIHIDAPPERVWPLVVDLDLLVSISTELQEVNWLDGCAGPALGRRFLGRNFHPAMGEWETISTVTACDEPTEYAWQVGAFSGADLPSSSWRFTLSPERGGTTLTQWMRMGPGRNGMNIAIEARPDKEERILERRVAELRTGMERNLAEFKRRVEQ
jgi:hypothetical protein